MADLCDPILTIYRKKARQRFAIVAENIDPQPWAWHVTDGEDVRTANSAFKVTAWMWGRCALAWMRHEHRMLDR